MIGQQKVKGKKNGEASLTNDVERSSIFGNYPDKVMIAQLKRLAVDPCRLQFAQENIQPLCDQILRLKMVLKDSKSPWRKRKLEQFVNKLRHPADFPVPDQQNISKLSRKQLSHVSSMSSLINSVDDSIEGHYDKALSESRNSSSLLTSEETLSKKYSSIENGNCHKKYTIIDSDESVNGSNPTSPENRTHIAKHHLKSPTLHGSNKKCVIPIGPRFQTDVPEWSGSVNKSILLNGYRLDSENSKWLGFRVWPAENGSMKSNGATIGKGRSSSCSCISPGSVDCIKRHSLEARLILQCDLGPAFFSWKFDEIGWNVSKSWTFKEQQTFESQLKMRSSSSNGKSFPKRALKSLPNKSGKEMINYYFNVYIPHRLSVQTRSSSAKVVDSEDEDETDDIHYLGVAKRSEEKAMH